MISESEIIKHFTSIKPSVLANALKRNVTNIYLDRVQIEEVIDNILIKIINAKPEFEHINALDYYIRKSAIKNMAQQYCINKVIRSKEKLSTQVMLKEYEKARNIINMARSGFQSMPQTHLTIGLIAINLFAYSSLSLY